MQLHNKRHGHNDKGYHFSMWKYSYIYMKFVTIICMGVRTAATNTHKDKGPHVAY